MKPIIYLAFIFSLTNLYSQSFASVNLDDYTGKTYSLNVLIGQVDLTLNKNGTYTASYGSEGMWWYNEGKFERRKDILQLLPDSCKFSYETPGQVPCIETLGRAKIELEFSDESLYYTEYLKISSEENMNILGMSPETNVFRIGVTGKEVREGAARKHEGINVVSMGGKKGITTSEVKIRKTPSTSGEVLNYYPGLYDDMLKAVPINTTVTVIARTVNKEQVQKWNNYWYLVNVDWSTEVWMFGEFVKF